MKILGIETSCDETAAAVVEDGTKILSNVISSSAELQKKYGGILPEQAAREQVKYIIPVIQEALLGIHSGSVSQTQHHSRSGKGYDSSEVRIAREEIDAIAVTTGPGLIGSLLVGVETAKTMAYVLNKPIIPINHHLGHIYASWLQSSHNLQLTTHNQQPILPAICLIVSGGHTLLLYMQDHGKWQIIGQTRDDAAGEAFDKTARLFGLSYPGGPAIEKAAMTGNPQKYRFPRPMIDSADFDFSFSGLKTAVLREVRHLNLQPTTHNLQLRSDLAASTQEAIIDVLIAKTLRAAKEYNIKTIIIGGGVAANKRLNEKLATYNLQLITNERYTVHIPPPNLCTDNAAVIASAGYFNHQPLPWKDVYADANLQFPERSRPNNLAI